MYVDEDVRKKKIKEGEGISRDWDIDDIMMEGIKFYNSFKTSSILLLEDMKGAVDKLRVFIRDIDLGMLDEKGKPIYTLNSVTATIK